MTKIGILTYHNNENKGAILQSFCLSEVLTNIFNEKVDVIEYRTASRERRRKIKTLVTKHPSEIPSRIKDQHACEFFIEEKLNTSSSSITTDSHKKATKWLGSQNYDILITGSDEIWKINNRQSKWRAKLIPTRPFPNLYYLDPNLSSMKVAYAASANRTNIDSISTKQREQFQNHLKAYDFISVRDGHTENILKRLGVENIYRVPDPTLMHTIPTRDVEPILKRSRINTNKKILGIHGDDNSVFEELCDHYRQKGYQIVSMTESQYADLNLRGKVGPFEYYSMYKQFDIVATNSLHSTIFSLKHGTPFVTIDTDSMYQNIESKTHSLLNDFDMTDRHIDAVDRNMTSFYKYTDQFEAPINESCIRKHIEKLQKQGNMFLDIVNEGHEAHN